MSNFSGHGPKVDWDCWIDETRKRVVHLNAGIETGLCEQDLFGAGIRCFSAGRVGFAATTQKHDLENTLRAAHELSRYGPADDLPQDSDVEEPVGESNQNGRVPLEDATNYMAEIKKLLRKKEDSRCTVELVSQRMRYQNSQGRNLSAQRQFCHTLLTRNFWSEGKNTKLNIFHHSPLNRGKSLEESSALFFARLPVASSPDNCEVECLFVEQASTLLLEMLARNLVLLFKTLTRPEVYASLLENLALNRLVNLTDAADAKRGFTFDGEGGCCRKVTVMRAGRLASAIFDRRLAKSLRVQVTGNAIRRYNNPPYLDFRTLVLGNGDRSYRSMLQEMTGMLILEMKDTLVNSNFGEYKLEILHAIRIDKGQPVGRVLSGHIAVNLMHLFGKNLLELGEEYYRNLRVNSVPIRAVKVCFV